MGLCGKFQTTSLVCGRMRLSRRRGSKRHRASLPWLPERHLTAQRHGQLVQRLVAGEGADHVIAWVEQGVHEEEDGLLRCGDEDRVAAHRLVEAGHLRPQLRSPLRLRVSQPQTVPPGEEIGVGEGQQFLQRQPLAVGGREQMAGRELGPGEEPLECKWFGTHGPESVAGSPTGRGRRAPRLRARTSRERGPRTGSDPKRPRGSLTLSEKACRRRALDGEGRAPDPLVPSPPSVHTSVRDPDHPHTRAIPSLVSLCRYLHGGPHHDHARSRAGPHPQRTRHPPIPGGAHLRGFLGGDAYRRGGAQLPLGPGAGQMGAGGRGADRGRRSGRFRSSGERTVVALCRLSLRGPWMRLPEQPSRYVGDLAHQERFRPHHGHLATVLRPGHDGRPAGHRRCAELGGHLALGLRGRGGAVSRPGRHPRPVSHIEHRRKGESAAAASAGRDQLTIRACSSPCWSLRSSISEPSSPSTCGW